MRRSIKIKLVKRGRLTVAVPDRRLLPLTPDEVAETLVGLRRRGLPPTFITADFAPR
jgi:hypothetical protein